MSKLMVISAQANCFVIDTWGESVYFPYESISSFSVQEPHNDVKCEYASFIVTPHSGVVFAFKFIVPKEIAFEDLKKTLTDIVLKSAIKAADKTKHSISLEGV